MDYSPIPVHHFRNLLHALPVFNPFGADTLTSVAQSLERSLKETPRRLVIGYFNPVHRDVLDASPVLRRRVLTRHWAIYEAIP